MNYIISNGPMISASNEVLISTFDRYEDPVKPGFYWFVKADIPNKAEYIFYGSPHTTNSEGMGGRVIPFRCTDGQTINIQGPWWSNSDSFYGSTGIDIRNTNYTFVVVARSVDRIDRLETLIDVVYKDDEPTIGPFDRWKTILSSVFQVLNDDQLVIYVKSDGGSSLSYHNRDDVILHDKY
jgi:hypothetical protein